MTRKLGKKKFNSIYNHSIPIPTPIPHKEVNHKSIRLNVHTWGDTLQRVMYDVFITIVIKHTHIITYSHIPGTQTSHSQSQK